jgi:hypothetical protein
MSNIEFIESVEQPQTTSETSEAMGAAKIYTLTTSINPPEKVSTSGSWNVEPGNSTGTLWQYADAPARNCMSASDFWSALSEATNRMNRLDADAHVDVDVDNGNGY